MKRQPMTKPLAVAEIFANSKQQRQPNPAEFRRLIRALEALALTPAEMLEACRHLDLADKGGHCFRRELEPFAPWLKVPA